MSSSIVMTRSHFVIQLISRQLLTFFLLFTGDNGRIEYSITAGDDDDFEIVPNGTIYTKRMLDRETKSTYNLVVTARDSPKDVDKRLSSTVQVKISFHTFNFNNLFVSTSILERLYGFLRTTIKHFMKKKLVTTHLEFNEFYKTMFSCLLKTEMRKETKSMVQYWLCSNNFHLHIRHGSASFLRQQLEHVSHSFFRCLHLTFPELRLLGSRSKEIVK